MPGGGEITADPTIEACTKEACDSKTTKRLADDIMPHILNLWVPFFFFLLDLSLVNSTFCFLNDEIIFLGMDLLQRLVILKSTLPMLRSRIHLRELTGMYCWIGF